MLADSSSHNVRFGQLGRDVHLPATALDELIDFIASELPVWRDHPQRPRRESETALTSQLCGHLTTAARHSTGWDILQFRVEEPDEIRPARKIDLVASACGPTIWIEGRRCAQFETLLPIECKRLPTPLGRGRDEREYVINRNSTTGGIQRFKAGDHGAAHTQAAMIGYVQRETPPVWHHRLNAWIADLEGSNSPGWSAQDMLRADSSATSAGVATYRSRHARVGGLSEISLRHLWIALN